MNQGDIGAKVEQHFLYKQVKYSNSVILATNDTWDDGDDDLTRLRNDTHGMWVPRLSGTRLLAQSYPAFARLKHS